MIGLAWMAVCGFVFTLFILTLKLKLGHVHAMQSSFMRYVGGLVWLLPYVGFLSMRQSKVSITASWSFDKVSLWRGAAHALGVCLWFYAIVRIPMADVSALSNISPIYATLGAAFFFGEQLRLRRLVAIGVSLLGALLIIRPGFVEVNAGVYAMLLASPIFAISDLLGKRMASRQSNVTVVLQLTLVVTVLLALPAFTVWQNPSWLDWVWASVVGLFATLGHFCLSQAFKVSEMWVAQSGKFFQLIFASVLGMLILGSAVPLTTWLGGGVIVCSVSYIAWRESQLRKSNDTTSVSSSL